MLYKVAKVSKKGNIASQNCLMISSTNFPNVHNKEKTFLKQDSLS